MSTEQTSHSHTNHLINENSPYLLQHAHNPVDWHPWGPEALAKAKAEDKPLIISIGYAACHWCHVMEHESFEDLAVADSMNTLFVNVKVDREERPDIDDVYMTACQLSSGRGCGWPLNAFALPDGRPFWAGTYFPKDQWLNVLKQFADLWQNDRQKLEEYADKLTQGIQAQDELMIGAPQDFSGEIADTMAAAMLRSMDWEAGGRQGAPKFPMPVNYSYLLDYHIMTGNEEALRAVDLTLDEMARGGIYDQLGGGFSRYSVDAQWLAPHFEKMMYDNGQLMSLYSAAYQVTKNEQYRRVVDETFDWLTLEMTNDEGGFYSSLDADSEGEEGKFYVWTWEELTEIIPADDLDLFASLYGCTEAGNWEHGQNILHLPQSRSKQAQQHGLSDTVLTNKIDQWKDMLTKVRDQRVRPGLDDKILTSWNALMIKGLVDAYRAFGDVKFLQAAEKNATFLQTNMLQADGRLDRNYKDGTSKINAFLDDYALLAQAYMALYEVTFEVSWLHLSKQLVDYAHEHFYNNAQRLYNYTSDLDPALVARKLEINDNVIPASNSIMARNLNFLAHFFADEQYTRISDQMLFNLVNPITQSGQTAFYANWARLYLEKMHPTFEIVIMGPEADNLRSRFQSKYLANAIYLGGQQENLPLLESKSSDITTIYVCQNKVCQFPVHDVEEAFKLVHYLD